MSSPMVVVYKMLMLIKTWRPLVKPKLSAMTDEMITMITAMRIKNVAAILFSVISAFVW
jgi:hypothetical protein